MAKWNVVNLSTLENFKDFSSEYYKKEFLCYSNLIRRIGVVRAITVSFITDGEHGSPCWSSDSGINYITAEYIKENYILNGEYKQISLEQDRRNSRARLQNGDILIYSVGAYAGYAAVAEPHLFPANIPRSVAIIRLKKDCGLLPEYVSAFLNSKYGSFQTFRLRAGNSQPVLALDKIRQLEIPLLDQEQQNVIKDIYNLAYKKRMESRLSYKKAVSLLENKLHLNDLSLTKTKTFIAQFSDVIHSQRIDSGHYRNEFKVMFNFISNSFECKTIGDLTYINKRGLQPTYTDNGGNNGYQQ